MNKRKAITRLILVSILTLFGAFLCIFSFPIPGAIYDFKGFANSIKQSNDLNSGVVAVYNATLPLGSQDNLSDALEETIARLQNFVAYKNYRDAIVVAQGESNIRVEVPNINNNLEVFYLIGQPKKIEFKKQKDTEDQIYDADLTGRDIENVIAMQSGGRAVVKIDFTKEGSTKFYNLTNELAKEYQNTGSEQKLNIYFDGVLRYTPSVTSANPGGVTYIDMGVYSESSMAYAEEMAITILTGSFATELERATIQTITPILGQNAMMWLLIASAIGLLIIFALLYYFYRTSGLAASFAVVIYFVILIILLQAVPLVQLSFSAVAGIVLSLALTLNAMLMIFERIKEEYNLGKRIPASVDSGFKKSIWAIVDINILTAVASVALFFLGTGAIKDFVVTLFLGTAVSTLTTLFILKRLINNCLLINCIKPKYYGLRRVK